jgi:osmotically-inducible protein OsmY
MTVHPRVFETARYSKSSQPRRRHVLTDTHIQEAVRAALDDDARIKHPELIAVSVDGIGTVVLRGAVEALPERLAAKHDAQHVEGVLDVIVDDLKVHPPLAHRRPDDEILAAAFQRLTSDPRIRSTHIHVKVSHGHLTLTGYVREDSERAAAREDVASLPGVIEVTDRIELR